MRKKMEKLSKEKKVRCGKDHKILIRNKRLGRKKKRRRGRREPGVERTKKISPRRNFLSRFSSSFTLLAITYPNCPSGHHSFSIYLTRTYPAAQNLYNQLIARRARSNSKSVKSANGEYARYTRLMHPLWVYVGTRARERARERGRFRS